VFKKIAAVVATSVLIFGMTACSGKSVSENSPAAGADSSKIVVPDVVGLSYHDALLALGTVSLDIEHSYVPEDTLKSVVDASIISKQNPAAGESVEKLTVVKVTIPNPETEQVATDEPEPTEEHTNSAEDAAAGKELVKAVTASLKEAFGVDKFSEAQDLDPSFWIGYISDISSTGDGGIVVILDIPTDDAYGYGFDGASNAIMSLVGQENDDLQGVIVKTSEGDVLGDTVRSDIPILN